MWQKHSYNHQELERARAGDLILPKSSLAGGGVGRAVGFLRLIHCISPLSKYWRESEKKDWECKVSQTASFSCGDALPWSRNGSVDIILLLRNVLTQQMHLTGYNLFLAINVWKVWFQFSLFILELLDFVMNPNESFAVVLASVSADTAKT